MFDTGFSGRVSVCWRAGKTFSCQHLDLNFSLQDLQKNENRSTDKVFMTEKNFVYGFSIVKIMDGTGNYLKTSYSIIITLNHH